MQRFKKFLAIMKALIQTEIFSVVSSLHHSPEGESGEDFIMRNINPKKCRKDIFVVNKSISWGCFSIFTITISASMYNSMAEIVADSRTSASIILSPSAGSTGRETSIRNITEMLVSPVTVDGVPEGLA